MGTIIKNYNFSTFLDMMSHIAGIIIEIYLI